MKKILFTVLLGFIIIFKSNGMNIPERLKVKDIIVDTSGVYYNINNEFKFFSAKDDYWDGFIPYSNIITIERIKNDD
jgi:hypothetical protein